jgi:hypothetical protein
MNNTERSTPAPLETDPGEQKDDNLDDLGHKPDGSKQDQPVNGGKSPDQKSEQSKSH